MLIKKIKLHNYRNYSLKEISFDPYINIIVGRNGIGKTNILESIIFISNTKSFRTNDDKDLIKKNEEYARIDLYSDVDRYSVVINKKNKSLFINNNIIKKTSDYIGKINAIIFKPSDLELFSQTPSERRRILDIEISKVSKRYIQALSKFNQLLKDKNKLLKELEVDQTLLDIINESMCPLIKVIIEERERFFNTINENISKIYKDISGINSEIKINYQKCCEVDEIKNEMQKAKEKDDYYHYATFGPHHDDYYFIKDKYELNSIASQGQKRITLVSFKLALIEYIKQMNNTIPIVLLDDILSELDRDNCERLLQALPDDNQIIITDIDVKHLNINRNYKLIEIKEEENV